MLILGLMSGTSLDGVDLALCQLQEGRYAILQATTVPYPPSWRQRLARLHSASALQYVQADAELGHYYGKIINEFLAEYPDLKVDAIVSHGHTVFHQPPLFTSQIGSGNAIAADTGLLVISDFRTLDVALGGQGAPLVPIGDKLLFGAYDACLNLGGIANISFDNKGRRIAFDICPCNMVLNRLAALLGLPYDPQGEHARRGKVNRRLLDELDSLDYYHLPPPKSLGREWVDAVLWPLIAPHMQGTDGGLHVDHLLATVSEHIAHQIADVLRNTPLRSLLVTGGGAHNSHLVKRLAQMLPQLKLTVPDRLIVDYKEALIFAFLGYLRLTGKANTLASVTGAKCDSIGGTISGLAAGRKNGERD